MKILHVDSSISGETSITRRLSRGVVARLLALHPHAEVTVRDLAAEPLPYFDAATLADPGPGDPVSEGSSKPEAGSAARVLAEFMDANIVVVGVPMYNFGVPAQLKTWIDYISVAGVTFRYTAQGPEGLARGRRVILASARGGLYPAGTPQAAAEHQESYLKAVFGFFGIAETEVVRAEGVRISPETAAASIDTAEAQIASLRP